VTPARPAAVAKRGTGTKKAATPTRRTTPGKRAAAVRTQTARGV
jgi:hypothetical protein